jgi:hypothetical protein
MTEKVELLRTDSKIESQELYESEEFVKCWNSGVLQSPVCLLPFGQT